MNTTLTTVVNAALLAVKNKDAIHYTQNSPARWSGIHDKLNAAKGQFPHYADCSSFATWCLWQVLGDGPDIVNGTDWKSGYTGTLSRHGREVPASAAQPGDLVFYGTPIYHVAIVIGRKSGQLIVASHGEESGPYVVKYNQWGVNSIRRYLATDAPQPAPNPLPTPEVTLSAAEVTEIKTAISNATTAILAAISSERATNEAYQHDNNPLYPQPGANDHLLEGQKALLREAGLDPEKVYTGPKK